MSAATPAPEAIYGLTLPFGYGRAQVVPIVQANPAVATGFTRRVAGVGLERLAALTFMLTTDANVANRAVRLSVVDADSNLVFRLAPLAVQAAGAAVVYSYAIDVAASVGTVDGTQVQRLPPLILQTGWAWSVTIGAVAAGDQISAIGGLVERFLYGPRGFPLGSLTPDQQLTA